MQINKNASGLQIRAQGSFSGSAESCLEQTLHSKRVFVEFGENKNWLK
jgi:hypothetical protein